MRLDLERGAPAEYFLGFVFSAFFFAFLSKPAKETVNIFYSKKRMAKETVLAALPAKAMLLVLFISLVGIPFLLIFAWQTLTLP